MPPDYQDNSFEWDIAKEENNYHKHQLRFDEAVAIFTSPVKEFVVIGGNPPEARILAIGLINKKEYTVIYTLRNERMRIISARRARTKERKQYWESLK